VPRTRDSIAVVGFATVRLRQLWDFPNHVSHCLFLLESSNSEKTYFQAIRQYSFRPASNVLAD